MKPGKWHNRNRRAGLRVVILNFPETPNLTPPLPYPIILSLTSC